MQSSSLQSCNRHRRRRRRRSTPKFIEPKFLGLPCSLSTGFFFYRPVWQSPRDGKKSPSDTALLTPSEKGVDDCNRMQFLCESPKNSISNYLWTATWDAAKMGLPPNSILFQSDSVLRPFRVTGRRTCGASPVVAAVAHVDLQRQLLDGENPREVKGFPPGRKHFTYRSH